jgi:hypothetical protein
MLNMRMRILASIALALHCISRKRAIFVSRYAALREERGSLGCR